MSIKLEANLIKSAICKLNSYDRPNPTLFYFPGLTSKPVWNKDKFKCVKVLEENFNLIKQEYIDAEKSNILYNDYKLVDNEKSLHKGDWSWYSFISKGKVNNDFHKIFPQTYKILSSLDEIMYNIPFAYSFFSNLENGSEILPHYGPCNIRLRIHLGIEIPDNECFIEIAGNSKKWNEGKCIVFDDTFIHSVQNKSGKRRIILLIDTWHPELHYSEKEAITNMLIRGIEKTKQI